MPHVEMASSGIKERAYKNAMMATRIILMIVPQSAETLPVSMGMCRFIWGSSVMMETKMKMISAATIVSTLSAAMA